MKNPTPTLEDLEALGKRLITIAAAKRLDIRLTEDEQDSLFAASLIIAFLDGKYRLSTIKTNRIKSLHGTQFGDPELAPAYTLTFRPTHDE